MSAADNLLEKEERQQIGRCAYCGQSRYIHTLGEVSQAELDAMATDQCLCAEAQAVKRKKAKEKKIKEFVEKKFIKQEMIDFIWSAIRMLEDSRIEEFQIKIYKDRVCKIWVDNDGYLHIRIKKTEDDELKA